MSLTLKRTVASNFKHYLCKLLSIWFIFREAHNFHRKMYSKYGPIERQPLSFYRRPNFLLRCSHDFIGFERTDNRKSKALDSEDFYLSIFLEQLPTFPDKSTTSFFSSPSTSLLCSHVPAKSTKWLLKEKKKIKEKRLSRTTW